MRHFHLRYPNGDILEHSHGYRGEHEHDGMRKYARSRAKAEKVQTRYRQVRSAYLCLLRAGRYVPISWTADKVIEEASKL